MNAKQMQAIPAALPPQPASPPKRSVVTVDVRLTLAATTTMVDMVYAMDRMAAAVGGSWSYQAPAGAERGRFFVEAQP